MERRGVWVVALGLSVLALGCSSPAEEEDPPIVRIRTSAGANDAPPAPVDPGERQVAVAADPKFPAEGVPFASARRLGAPVVVDNLTVWPVLSARVLDLGEFLTLREAQERESVQVRELGGTGGQQREVNVQQLAPRHDGEGETVRQIAFVQEQGAQVNALVVENTGELPILIPAGTVVKGGKQDRQIGQDVVVQAGQTLSVDAFCVERGRWSAQRAGVATQGIFEGQAVLALKSVRHSAQYAADQSDVWEEVGKANHAYGKAPQTGTLLATLEDEDKGALAYRQSVAQAVRAHLQGARGEGAEAVVGFAYAIDGEPVSVRTFAHPRVLAGQLEAFLTTMSLEVDLAQRRTLAAGEEVAHAPADPARVVAFVEGLREAVAERKRMTSNTNVYRKSEAGGSSACLVQDEQGEWVPLTEDWTTR